MPQLFLLQISRVGRLFLLLACPIRWSFRRNSIYCGTCLSVVFVNEVLKFKLFPLSVGSSSYCVVSLWARNENRWGYDENTLREADIGRRRHEFWVQEKKIRGFAIIVKSFPWWIRIIYIFAMSIATNLFCIFIFVCMVYHKNSVSQNTIYAYLYLFVSVTGFIFFTPMQSGKVPTNTRVKGITGVFIRVTTRTRYCEFCDTSKTLPRTSVTSVYPAE